MSSAPEDISGSARLPTLHELGGDLTITTPLQRFVTLAAPFAGLAAYAAFATMGWWPAAIVAVMFLSFVTYGSTSHDLVHHNIGLPRRLNDMLLGVIEGLSLRSGRAYQRSHLHHHRCFPHEDDIEAATAGSLARSLLAGPLLQPRLWLWAWRRFPGDRPVLAAEAAWISAFLLAAVAVWPWTAAPAVYAALAIAGSWAFPLITVYIPHDPCGRGLLSQTRAFRGRVLSLIAWDHLYHLEHHLYPAVPHHHWKRLARRLDRHLEAAGVKPRRLWF